MKQQVLPGIDTFLREGKVYSKKRLALITNNSATTSKLITTRTALLQNGFNLIKLFSPEHGLTATGADGFFQDNTIDSISGLPVISLYGNRLSPAKEDFSDIDKVIFDIPDVGCRFYTYLWTMTYVMEACALYGKTFILLDRPNPVGGNIEVAEGPMLDETICSSFIGRWSIPVRHSCTLGELALYFAATKIKGLDIEIFPVKKWDRNQMAGTAGFSFIQTSPAIKNTATTLLYSGMGLLEGVNVNEGRGTDRPFQLCGAPWINQDNLQEIVMSKNIPGITCKAYSYIPGDSLYTGELCNGIEFFITDEKVFRPVATGLAVLKAIFDLYPDHVKERLYSTNANPTGRAHLDKLLGVENAFIKIKSGEGPDIDVADLWPQLIKSFLLY